MRRLLLSLLAMSLVACAQPTALAPVQRPNVLLIVADDLGYSDLGAFGGEIRTPHLDGLAQRGTRLTSFYASPFCSPSRAMLLTGVDNHRAGYGDMESLMVPQQKGKPGYEGFLNDRVIPVSQSLRDAGYRTMMAGKWHLGNSEAHSPAQRGFDRSFAVTRGAIDHFGGPYALVPNDRQPADMYRVEGKPWQPPDQGFYTTKAFTDKLIGYLEDSRGSGKPFFAYLAYTAPHWPIQAPDDDIARVGNRYHVGYDAIRKARLERMKSMGLLDARASSAPPHTGWPEWRELTEAQRASESRRMAVYAAMVENMDHHIGRVLEHLKASGELDNTLVLFVSDNGADGNSIHDFGRSRAMKQHGIDNSTTNLGRPGSFADYGPGWGQVSMTPLRLYKTFVYEGGISVPAIVSGPGVAKGAILHAPAHVTDVAPTLLALAGASPQIATGMHAPQGRAMLEWLAGRSQRLHPLDHAFGWELGGRKAIRQGDWKLVQSNAPWGSGDWELYDLATDRAEQKNLVNLHPQKMQELLAAWREYAATNGVVEIEGLASRPGYGNGTGYYRALTEEAATPGAVR
jgi:arylsulfatase A-like enzyme